MGRTPDTELAAAPERRRLTPAVARAGAVAAALSLAVSGGAYAAVRAADQDVAPISESQVRIEAIGASPSADATAAAGLAVQGEALTVTTEVEETAEAHGTVEQETDELPAGERKVATEGVDGLTRTTYQVTRSGDQEVSRETVSTVVVTAKVDEVVLVGTGTAAPTESADTSTSETSSGSGSSTGTTPTTSGGVTDGSVWQKLAQCESGNNPAANTGNGYYGLYQFSLSTWRAMGGTGYPHEADAATQTAMAQKLQAQSGWGQWPACAAKLGLL
ncbi:MAG: resuscitation-promoting factor [Actinomyces sp.]|uniref:resuscitation-promoting factor n=1 Tax=Actinomyces sp. TaxID=29317 RepID=UPI0026DD0B6C|nr:resuscitation-promoting factor [Actinomyces sp.]MDO4243495.1 resuscitation-promoting factor [Actinomyces sp.]